MSAVPAYEDGIGTGESIGSRLQEIACDCRNARRTEAAARDVCQQRITVLLNALRSDLCCDHARHIGHSTRILAAANSAAMDALRFFTAAFAALYVARPALGSSAAKEEAFKITPPPCAFMYG